MRILLPILLFASLLVGFTGCIGNVPALTVVPTAPVLSPEVTRLAGTTDPAATTPVAATEESTPSPTMQEMVTLISEKAVISVFIPQDAPRSLGEIMTGLEGYRVVADQAADLRLIPLEDKDAPAGGDAVVEEVYALVAPFPTVVDEVSLAEIQRAWKGGAVGAFGGNPLLVSPETLACWSAIWGEPLGDGVAVIEADDLLQAAWGEGISWALVPFGALEPRWKTLRVDGVSVFDADLSDYPLAARYTLAGDADLAGELRSDLISMGLSLPVTNRDQQKMTTLLLTGVTALVRRTAEKMEENGITYPAEAIIDWMVSADLTHISNEVPFYSDCPPALPLRSEARFCSAPSYYELLQYSGVDIVELTGNHLMDWGKAALIETLDLYKQEGMPYYGGGYNLEDAQKPLEIEHNGNRLVFLGCNAMGPESDWATGTRPGSAPCDLDQLEAQVKAYAAQGYLPVVTFQHFEICQVAPQSAQRVDFQRMALAGAVIVSGSQAHCPQGMTFYGDSFVHYGLGNLFFDQMESDYGRGEFLDRHIFYNGRYISTELLTAQLEDYAQPRPMTDAERRALLEDVFEESVWSIP